MKLIQLLLLITLSVVVLIAALFIGTDYSSFTTKDITNEQYKAILLNVRTPRVIMAFVVGGVLSLGGFVFQLLFRNALATPYTLGVASGASFGVALYYLLGANIVIPSIFGGSMFAFTGALLTILLVSIVSRYSRDNNLVLLMGIALSFLFSSFIMFVQYITDLHLSQRILRFTFGGIDGASYTQILFLFPIASSGLLLIIFFRRELAMISVSDDFAASRGVDVDRVKFLLYLFTSIMIGVVVSLVGPIGFVGMMIPHITRVILGTTHKYFIVIMILFGGIFLTICDTIARILIYPAQIPVGIITSILGGIFFITILIRNIRKTV